MERVAESLETWRPDIEGTIDDLRLEVNKLNNTRSAPCLITRMRSRC
jgi:hypothetical protein